jgi:hypothetical protein
MSARLEEISTSEELKKCTRAREKSVRKPTERNIRRRKTE